MDIFHDHVTAYFTSLGLCALRKYAELLPRLWNITKELRLALNQLHESTCHLVYRYIISDHERERTGSHYSGENGVELLVKHNVLGTEIKALEKTTDDRSSLVGDGKRESKKSKRSASCFGSTKVPSGWNSTGTELCFLFCTRGHYRSDRDVPRSKWVEIDTLTVE